MATQLATLTTAEYRQDGPTVTLSRKNCEKQSDGIVVVRSASEKQDPIISRLGESERIAIRRVNGHRNSDDRYIVDSYDEWRIIEVSGNFKFFLSNGEEVEASIIPASKYSQLPLVHYRTEEEIAEYEVEGSEKSRKGFCKEVLVSKL